MDKIITPALILSCNKNAHLRAVQKELFLDDLKVNHNVHYYHIIGNPVLESEFEINESDSIITVRCKDDYNSLIVKTYLAFKALDTFYGDRYTHILKMDDDTFIDKNRFDLSLLTRDEFSGFIFKRRSGNVGPSGGFYVVSKNCVNILYQHEEFLLSRTRGAEDLEIGWILEKTYPPVKINEYINPFGDTDHSKKCIVYHWIKTPDAFHKLYERCVQALAPIT